MVFVYAILFFNKLPALEWSAYKQKEKGGHTMPQAMEQTSVKTLVRRLAQLASFITGVLADLSSEQITYWLGHKTLLRQKLREVFEIVADEFVGVRAEWEKFYLDRFGLVVDFSAVVIPPKPVEGDWRLIFIPAGLTLNATVAAMRKLFKVWVYFEDLDASVTFNARTTVQSYAIWVRAGVEPDEKYLGQSTRQADPDGKIGMTLLERLVLDVKHFVETEKHLDEKGVTFCTASRDAYGSVPHVYWFPADGKVNVDWYGLDNANPANGLREAVAL